MQLRALPPTTARKAVAIPLASIFSPHDRLTHIHRFLLKPLRISRKPRQPIRELECTVVETTGFTVPLLRSSHTSVRPNSQRPHMRQLSKSELRLNRHPNRCVFFTGNRNLLRSRSCVSFVTFKHQHKGVGLFKDDFLECELF